MSNKNNSTCSLVRPQTPQRPFHYQEYMVEYPNRADGITLAGTLTIPNGTGPFPVVILINGMGPMDRDATFMGHKRFMVIADHFTQQGIAVLRVDKRGIGQSTGVFSPDITSRDLANDVLVGIEYLKTRTEINPHKIGLIGHSEGGLIATMVAAESQAVAFIILMSGAIITDIEGQTAITATQLRFDGASEALIASDCAVRKQVLAIVITEQDVAIATQKMDAIITHYWSTLSDEQKQEAEKFAFALTLSKKEKSIATFNSPWFRYFFTYNVMNTLKKITIPVLALNGEFDFNAPDIAFPVLRTALHAAGNTHFTTMVMPKLNHNMQSCKTGALAEYGTIEETIQPAVLTLIVEWIQQQL